MSQSYVPELEAPCWGFFRVGECLSRPLGSHSVWALGAVPATGAAGPAQAARLGRLSAGGAGPGSGGPCAVVKHGGTGRRPGLSFHSHHCLSLTERVHSASPSALKGDGSVRRSSVCIYKQIRNLLSLANSQMFTFSSFLLVVFLFLHITLCILNVE